VPHLRELSNQEKDDLKHIYSLKSFLQIIY
jgi:hypothetical protein